VADQQGPRDCLPLLISTGSSSPTTNRFVLHISPVFRHAFEALGAELQRPDACRSEDLGFGDEARLLVPIPIAYDRMTSLISMLTEVTMSSFAWYTVCGNALKLLSHRLIVVLGIALPGAADVLGYQERKGVRTCRDRFVPSS
jgi:hypothetical protein